VKCKEIELEPVIQSIKAFAQNYQPKIVYCFVDRNISHRLFYKDNGSVLNPGPGTVLDTALVDV
jgi:hypothetical protein